MGKFKNILIEENLDSVVRTFKTKDQLPFKIKEYLQAQGYYLKAEGLALTEERAVTEQNLHFLGRGKYYSPLLTYIIHCIGSDKKMIIKTDESYSFFEMQKNSFLDDEY